VYILFSLCGNSECKLNKFNRAYERINYCASHSLSLSLSFSAPTTMARTLYFINVNTRYRGLRHCFGFRVPARRCMLYVYITIINNNIIIIILIHDTDTNSQRTSVYYRYAAIIYIYINLYLHGIIYIIRLLSDNINSSITIRTPRGRVSFGTGCSSVLNSVSVALIDGY